MTTSTPTGEPTSITSIPERKVTENRLRRIADRQGLRLVKSRRRDSRALAYGSYAIIDNRTGALVAGLPALEGYGLDLVDVADRLGADAEVRTAAVLAENAPNAVDRMVAGIIGAIASRAATVDRCARCGTPEPDTEAPEYIYWETLPDCSPLCPDCITPTERQATDEAIVDTAEQAQRGRRGEK